jgi:Integrase core domain
VRRPRNPYGNARAESFFKTLKYEVVYWREYRDLSEARACIERFLEKVYNEKRLHCALGYQPPAEFERSALARTARPSPMFRKFRRPRYEHGEIYRPMGSSGSKPTLTHVVAGKMPAEAQGTSGAVIRNLARRIAQSVNLDRFPARLRNVSLRKLHWRRLELRKVCP